MRAAPSVRRDLAGLALAALLLLVPAAALTDLFNPDEPREAEIAREMSVSGDRVVPLFNGCPFLEKPPLFYWGVDLAAALPGLAPELAARIPSMLAGLALMFVVYALGRELYDRRTGRAGAFLLLTTFQFWWYAKKVLLDMTLAAFIGAVMLCFVLAERRSGARFRWLVLAGAAAAGAAMTKGLIGLLIPAVAIAVYLVWTRNLRFLLGFAPAAALAIPILVLGVWVALLAMRPDGACYVREFLVENHVKRFLGGGAGGHRQPVWYYLESLLTDYQPWIFFLPAAALALWPGWRPERAGGRSQGGHALLWSWIVPSLVVLSAASSKRSLYLLPLAAPIALALAAWWRGWGTTPGRTRVGSGLYVTICSWILVLIGIAASIAAPAVIAVLLGGSTPRRAGDLLAALRAQPAGVPLGAAMLAAVVSVALLARRSRRRGAAACVLLAWAVWFIAGVGILPLAQPRLSARELGARLAELRGRGAALAASGLTEGSLGQFLYYSGGTIEWIARPSRNPESPCTDCRSAAIAREFLDGPAPRACLMRREDFERQRPGPPDSWSILAAGQVGGASYVLAARPDKGHGK